ncbi:MAG: T9SS type A sorting domain-containing protein [Chitinophagaceae bacterium]|nr:T9SS type A sorting domain-containing protein [Chitinophagaceae bacterium]
MRTRVLLFLPFFFCVVLSSVTGQVVTKVACTEYQAAWLYSDGSARSFIFNTTSGHVEFTPFQIGGRKAVDISTGFNRITMLDDQGYVWVNNGGQSTATRWDKDAYGNAFNGNVSIYGYFFTYLSIRSDGSIWYWGGDDYKFYGGKTLNAPVKLHTPPGVKFTKISTGNALLALSTTGDVYYWDKTDSNYTKIPLPKPASDIAASHMGYYIAVVPDDINTSKMGWPYAFGPESKYWGSEVPAAPTAPVSIKALWKMTYPIREINANQNTLHYIDSQGDMYGMGDNANGEVGNGEELVNHAEKYATPYAWNWGKYGLMVSSPAKILPGTKWKHLFTGNSFVFYNYATDVNDSLYFWGRNKSFVGGDGVSNSMEATLPNALDVLKPTLRTPLKLKPTDATIYSFSPYTLKAPAKQKIGNNSATLSATATPSTLSFPGKPNYGYTIVKYQWAQVSGPNTATITSPNALNTTVTGLVTGTYVYSIQTTDNNTGTITAYDTLVVNTSGVVLPTPVASAGTDQTITLPVSSVTLTGTGQISSGSSSTSGSTANSGSTGAVPTITGYQWTQVSGPNNATFANSKAAQTTVSGLIAGTYVFQLTVTDSQGQTGSAQVTVTVKPTTAVPTLTVNAGANQTVTLPAGATVSGTVTVTNSTVKSYQWTQVSGPSTAYFSSSSTAQSNITGLVAGTYVFKLTVTGSTGLTASAQLTLTVKPTPPATLTVNAGPDQTITWPSRANVAGTATATNSTVKSYQWLQVSGPAVAYFINSKVAQTQAVGLVAGTYVFKLTVTGSTGLTASDEMILTVKPGTPPTLTVDAGVDQTVILPSRATLTGSGRSTNNAITGYQWTQVSGPAVAYFVNSKAAQTQAVGLVAGIYVFRLTATGSAGLTASDEITVTAKTATTARAVAPDGEVSALSDSADDAGRTVRLYPNPVMTDQQFAVEGQGWKEGTLKFTVYDLSGRMVKQVVLDNQFSYFRQTIPAAGLTKGVYMLTIQAEGQKPKSLRFIVQ